jgi:hypothetical protein
MRYFDALLFGYKLWYGLYEHIIIDEKTAAFQVPLQSELLPSIKPLIIIFEPSRAMPRLLETEIF